MMKTKQKDILNVTTGPEAGSLENSCLKSTYTFENVGTTASGIAPPNPEWKYDEETFIDINVPGDKTLFYIPSIKDEEKLQSYLVQVKNVLRKI